MVCQECEGMGTIESNYLYASCASSNYIVDKTYEETCHVCNGTGEADDPMDDEG